MKPTLRTILYRIAKRYIRWADGFSYDFSKNGEEWILKELSSLNFSMIFDVGANVGAWTKNAQKYFPTAEIHCFEVSESTFLTLKENIRSNLCALNNFGLSDTESRIQYKDYGENFGSNTIILTASFHDNRRHPTLKAGYLRKGDDYIKSKSIAFIDFLKIDVEGADHLVLKGFSKMLTEGSIRLVQFEYGYTHGDSKFLMRDYYEMFDDFGYRVGKLRQGRVDFAEWTYALNDFDSGPNFVAVRASDRELIGRLS